MKDIEHQILFSYILTFMDTYCVPCFQIIQQPKKKKKKKSHNCCFETLPRRENCVKVLK